MRVTYQINNGWVGDDWWGRDDGGTPERVLPPRYEEPPLGPSDSGVYDEDTDVQDGKDSDEAENDK